MSDVDVIVLDYDGGAMIRRCIESIARQSVLPRRLIVHDNGSEIPLAERLEPPSLLDIRFSRTFQNLGFSGGINVAMQHVEAPFVAWINSDVELDPEWLATVRSAFSRDDRLGAAQSLVVRPDGRIDGGGIDVSDGTFRQRWHGEPVERAHDDDAIGVSATAAIYRTVALRAVARDGEVLDRRFFAWYEDVELAARLSAGGWRSRLIARPLAVHLGSATKPRLGTKAAHLSVRNRYFVARLHPAFGSKRALLAEDAKRIVRAVIEMKPGTAWRTAAAALEGLFSPLR